MTQVLRLAVYTSDAAVASLITHRFPLLDTRIEDSPAGFIQAAREADIVYLARKYERSMVLGNSCLKWLHLGGTGIDRLLPLRDLAPHVVLTHTPGLNPAMMADFTLCAMLMLVWDFPRLMKNQLARRWERWQVDRMTAKTVVVVGLGNIGRAVAARSRALGMRVLGVKRSPHPVPDVDRVVGQEDLLEFLGQADFVVLAVPLTSRTRGLIGPSEIRAMKKTAFLINVSRGAVVQEPALVEALREGRIAGAALDVFDSEPLPVDNELWCLPNVILSPHISGMSKDYQQRADDLFCTNLERYLSQRPLLHLIDRSIEY